MSLTSIHARRWITSFLALALVGIGGGVAIAATGGSGTATSGGPGTTYIPQLGYRVPNYKVTAIEHELGNFCYPKKCKAPSQAPRTPESPSGPLDRIPASFLRAGSEIPVSPLLLRFTNGWLVSNGKDLVGVYAGAAGDNSSEGRFVILRQNELTGKQTVSILNVPGTGALTIVGAPLGASVETSAAQGKLSFDGARGAQGTLDLSNDTIILR